MRRPEKLASPDLSWIDEGKCRSHDPDNFFADAKTEHRQKQICVGCPIRAKCLLYAYVNDIPFGVWGGLTTRERRKLKKQRSIAKITQSVA